MSTSYKSLWQEAKQEIDRLQVTIKNLKREKDELAAAITANRSERAATQPIVDLAGVARHMRVERFTPQQWKQRGHLPPVDFPEISEPLWYVTTIKDRFVTPTGRIWYDTPGDTGDLSPAA